jgi:hypothetical protein
MNPKDMRTFGYLRLSISGFKASVMDVVEFGLIMRIDIVGMISEVHVEQSSRDLRYCLWFGRTVSHKGDE